jgi:hypothetical protein
MCASFSPKCIWVGHFGRSSAKRDAAAIGADRGGQAGQAARGKKRDRAAHAEPHDGGRPRRLDLPDRSVGVAQHRVPVRRPDELARPRDLVRRIAGLEVAHGPVEQDGCKRHVTGLGDAVAHRADVVVHAEDLLDHDDDALRPAGGFGPIGTELVALRGNKR